MRAVILRDVQFQSQMTLTGEVVHHLNVIRLNVGEKLKILNGKGKVATAVVESVSKKAIGLSIEAEQYYENTGFLDVAVAKTKKDALEACLRSAVELGVHRVYLVSSRFSQRVQIDTHRIAAILDSAMEQSNNPWLPEIIELESVQEIDYKLYKNVFFFQTEAPSQTKTTKCTEQTLLLIGPEGGWSSEEHEFFCSKNNVKSLRLPTPIMRTPTAFICAVGFIHGLSDA